MAEGGVMHLVLSTERLFVAGWRNWLVQPDYVLGNCLHSWPCYCPVSFVGLCAYCSTSIFWLPWKPRSLTGFYSEVRLLDSLKIERWFTHDNKKIVRFYFRELLISTCKNHNHLCLGKMTNRMVDLHSIIMIEKRSPQPVYKKLFPLGWCMRAWEWADSLRVGR